MAYDITWLLVFKCLVLLFLLFGDDFSELFYSLSLSFLLLNEVFKMTSNLLIPQDYCDHSTENRPTNSNGGSAVLVVGLPPRLEEQL